MGDSKSSRTVCLSPLRPLRLQCPFWAKGEGDPSARWSGGSKAAATSSSRSEGRAGPRAGPPPGYRRAAQQGTQRPLQGPAQKGRDDAIRPLSRGA